MGYMTPTDAWVSADYHNHKFERNPPSREPGTDYACGRGTDLRAPEDGRVVFVDHNNDGDDGRRLRMYIPSTDEYIEWIHLQSILVPVNFYFKRGQRGLALSGGSAKGRDNGVGDHLHVTRRKANTTYRDAIDFELAVGSPAGGGSTPFNPTNPSEEDDMALGFIAYAKHLRREYYFQPDGVTHLKGGASRGLNAVGERGNPNVNQVDKNDFRMIVEAQGYVYDKVRALPEGKKLFKPAPAGQTVDAGAAKWPPSWS
jgi:hypothetical protein